MLRATPILIAILALGSATPAPLRAQELENSRTPATAGTNGKGEQGRLSGSNLSAGTQGPASETKMPPREGPAGGRRASPAQAGAPDTTKELFQH